VTNSRNLPVIGICLFLATCIFVLVSRFSVTTDLGLFLPQGQSVMEQALMSQLNKGASSNLVFAAISGEKPEELAKLNRGLTSLLSEDKAIVQVLNGEIKLSESDRDWVMNNRYHLTPSNLEKRFSVDGLKSSFDDRLRGLTSPLASLEKKFLTRDPGGEILQLLDRWQGSANSEVPVSRDGIWFSADGSRSLLIIELKSTGLEISSRQMVVRRIYQTFEGLNPENSELVLSGPSVFSMETRDVITSEAKILTLVASTLVILFLLGAFHSVRLLLLTLVPLIGGVVAACAVVILVFGNIHGITLAFGVTLTGVAVDYPIHFFSHLGSKKYASSEDTIRTIWPTLRLGVLSTIVAYLILTLSEFTGLQQLGLFTVVGLITAAAITRWVLPRLVSAKLITSDGLLFIHKALRFCGTRLAGKGVYLLVVIPLVMASVYFSDTPLRNLDVDSLSPIGQERRNDDRQIRADLGFWYGGKLMLVIGADSEAALRASEDIREKLDTLIEEGAFQRYDMAANYVPSLHQQKQQLAAIPDEKTLRSRVDEALIDSPFKKGIFEPFINQAIAAKTNPLLSVVSLQNSQMGERLKAMLFEQDGLWIAPILLHGVTDEFALQSLNQTESNFQVIYMNIKAEATRILSDSIANIVPLLLTGIAAIYIFLAIGFKSFVRPIRVLMPTFCAVAVTLGLLNALGISLTLMHLVSLLLIVGLGLDYALFYDRLNHNSDEWESTFKALWVSSITTVFVFGILCFSSTPPLQAIGVTVGIGALMCLFFGACWTRTINTDTT